MNLIDAPKMSLKVTNPRYKKIKRVLAGLLVTLLLLGGSTAVMLSTRPPWHVITGSGKPGEWVASMECPDNWQLKEEQSSQNYKGFTTFTVHRKPLTGTWAWWNQHVLRRPQDDSNTELRLFVMPEPRFVVDGKLPAPISHADHVIHAESQLDACEFGFKTAQSGTGFKFISKRVSHPLGPALEVAMDDMRTANRGAGAPNTAGSHYDTLYIAPTEAGDFSGSIMVSYAVPEPSSPLKPILERMARSVRLVKK